jgi:Fe-S-cluster containining protein
MSMPDPNRKRPPGVSILARDLRRDLDRGLQFANVVLTVNQEQGNEAVAYAQALLELLVRKGIIGEEEIEEPLERARQEIGNVLMPRVRLGDMGDKRADGQGVDIDCPSLLHLCRARCCTFKFYLTKQDLDEGVARWDYGNPYWIRQGNDGYCSHCDPTTRGCTIHEDRPQVCRRFDCRHDKRIWVDFERGILAPPQPTIADAPVAMAEVALQNTMRAEQARADDDPAQS